MTKAYLLGFVCGSTGGEFDSCPFDGSRWYLIEYEHWVEGYWDGKEPLVDPLKSV